MESTQAAVVLDALLAAATAGLPDVEVADGQPIELNAPASLVIGWSPSRPGVEIAQERTGVTRDRRHETLTVACVITVWSGDEIPSAVRSRAVGILDDLRDVLAANRSLGGAVTRATLGFEGTLDQGQSTDGAAATLDFVVIVTTL